MKEEKIKNHFVTVGEVDRFTKIAEYRTPFPGLSLDAKPCENFLKINTLQPRINVTLNMEVIYRQNNEQSNLIFYLELFYYYSRDLQDSFNFLYEAEVLFLLDDTTTLTVNRPVNFEITLVNHLIGVSEEISLEGDKNLLSQLAHAKKIEYRINGINGKISEGELSKNDMMKIKGFYNFIFDPEFIKDDLLKHVEELEKIENKTNQVKNNQELVQDEENNNLNAREKAKIAKNKRIKREKAEGFINIGRILWGGALFIFFIGLAYVDMISFVISLILLASGFFMHSKGKNILDNID